jgi:hypothetical protein
MVVTDLQNQRLASIPLMFAHFNTPYCRKGVHRSTSLGPWHSGRVYFFPASGRIKARNGRGHFPQSKFFMSLFMLQRSPLFTPILKPCSRDVGNF